MPKKGDYGPERDSGGHIKPEEAARLRESGQMLEKGTRVQFHKAVGRLGKPVDGTGTYRYLFYGPEPAREVCAKVQADSGVTYDLVPSEGDTWTAS